MKRIIALLTAAMIIISLAACTNSGKGNESVVNDDSNAEETTAVQTEAQTTAAPAAVDISAWNWIKGELECYGYTDKGEPCYLSYNYPDNFTVSETNESGLQSRSYNFNPADSSANANESPYGLYINFGQGTFGGAVRESLEPDVPGGLTERELGGRTVLFGAMSPDPNTGASVFAYYTAYDDEEYARIWIILTDPEPDGAFRKAFEESMNFTKE